MDNYGICYADEFKILAQMSDNRVILRSLATKNLRMIVTALQYFGA